MKKNWRKEIICLCLAVLLLSGCGNTKYEAKDTVEREGNTFQIGNLQLEVKSWDKREEVKPKNPQGYYNHYKKEEGYYYHVLYGTLKNTGDKKVNVNQIKVEGLSNKEHYQGKIVLINEIQSYFWEEIEPGAELDFYIFSIVEKKEKAPSEYIFYFDEDGKIDKEQVSFDHKIKYSIPSELKRDKEN